MTIESTPSLKASIRRVLKATPTPRGPSSVDGRAASGSLLFVTALGGCTVLYRGVGFFPVTAAEIHLESFCRDESRR